MSVLGLGSELEPAEPRIEFRRCQIGQALPGNAFARSPRELAAQEDVMRRKARLLPRRRELLRYFGQRQPGHVRPIMPQEELHRFPQSRFAEFRHRLRVFLHRHMQRITRRENLPRRHEAFQFRRSQRFDRFRIIRQSTEDLLGYPLGFRFVGKVFLDPPASRIICELVHRLTAIDRVIEFDCLLSI